MSQEHETQKLIDRVQDYNNQLKGFGIEQPPDQSDNLNALSINSLKDLANSKSIKLQQCIDEGIEQTKSDCSYKG